MADERKRRNWPATIAMWLLVLVGVYGALYFGTCERMEDIDAIILESGQTIRQRDRYYGTKTVALTFAPAAWIEAQFIRNPVVVWYRRGPGSGRAAYFGDPIGH